jgi:hypothetical protein
VGRNRIEPVDKRAVASLEPAEAFGELLWLEAVRRGVEQAERVMFVSDGAAWIKSFHATHFPRALYVLGLWHLERACRDSLGAEHPALPRHSTALAQCPIVPYLLSVYEVGQLGPLNQRGWDDPSNMQWLPKAQHQDKTRRD